MNEIYLSSTKNLSKDDIETAIDKLLQQYDNLRKILIIPPDFTRCFSKAGDITQIIYKKLSTNVKIDIMPALGTHAMINDEERIKMYGDIPKANFLHHKWQSDTIKIGEVPKDFVAKISNNLFNDTIDVEVNKYFWEDDYDLILSIGQVVPHEVVGMANYSKNIFVGIGGRQMINKSHMLGAICGIEKALGNDHAPARQVFDYAQKHYLKNKPLVYILTVTTTNKDDTINLNGLYIGTSRQAYEQAVQLSQKLNITYLNKPAKKVVAYLNPMELKTTWVGNKGIYRSRMAIADGGELLLLAPGIHSFGENAEVDEVIRKYGYIGRTKILKLYNENKFPNQLMVPAHLIHGSSDDRFSITYAVNPKLISKTEIESVGFNYMNIDDAIKRYNPDKLSDGWQIMPDGEEIYFIKNPATGLWRLP